MFGLHVNQLKSKCLLQPKAWRRKKEERKKEKEEEYYKVDENVLENTCREVGVLFVCFKL